MTEETLIERLRAAEGGSRELDIAVCLACFPSLRPPMEYVKGEPKLFFDEPFYKQEPPHVTTSLDAAIALAGRMLPGWWWKVGTCCVSDDACCAPDYNDPEHSERLHRDFPLDKMPDHLRELFDGGFDIDRRPSGSLPLALLESMAWALSAIAEWRSLCAKEANHG